MQMCVSVHVLLKQQVQVKQRLRKIQEKSYGGRGGGGGPCTSEG